MDDGSNRSMSTQWHGASKGVESNLENATFPSTDPIGFVTDLAIRFRTIARRKKSNMKYVQPRALTCSDVPALHVSPWKFCSIVRHFDLAFPIPDLALSSFAFDVYIVGIVGMLC